MVHSGPAHGVEVGARKHGDAPRAGPGPLTVSMPTIRPAATSLRRKATWSWPGRRDVVRVAAVAGQQTGVLAALDPLADKPGRFAAITVCGSPSPVVRPGDPGRGRRPARAASHDALVTGAAAEVSGQGAPADPRRWDRDGPPGTPSPTRRTRGCRTRTAGRALPERLLHRASVPSAGVNPSMVVTCAADRLDREQQAGPDRLAVRPGRCRRRTRRARRPDGSR